MKKLYFLFIAIIATTVIVNAQYKLSSGSNAFVNGGLHNFVFTSAASEGASGENMLWDFTGLQKTDKTMTTKMSDISATDKAGLVPNANVVIEEDGNQFFFKVTSNGMEQYGASVGNMIIRFDKPFVKLKFPFSYSDKVSGDYSGVTISQNKESKISGTYEVVADAYGTLLLPENVTIKDALRVKQTKTFENSMQKEVIYRWYANGVRYPVLVIVKYESASQSVTSQTALYANLEDLNKQTEIASKNSNLLLETDVEVYPNPYREQFTVKYQLAKNSNVKIDLIGANGQLVKTVLNQKQDKGLNTQPILKGDLESPGTYYIRVTAGGSVVTKKVVQF
jgi:hypothetical protein